MDPPVATSSSAGPSTAAGDTRERLLDAAERLFAEDGIRETSLRAITAEAEANLAAVNYHFGSRNGLVVAVFQRRIGPMNAERLARLDALEAGGAPPALRDVLDAFLTPALTLGKSQGRGFFSIVARAHVSADPELRRLVVAQFAEVAARFGAALAAALPGADRNEIFWRVFFVVGALCQTVLNTPMLVEVTGGACDADDEEAVRQRLIDFATAGVASAASSAAPPPKSASKPAQRPRTKRGTKTRPSRRSGRR